MSLSKDSIVPPTTRQVTIRRCSARRNGSHLLPPAPKKGSAPCRAARMRSQARPDHDCSGGGWRKVFLLTDFVCSGRGAITGGGAASSSSSSSSDTVGTAGVSETAFTFCVCYTNGKNKNPIACSKQNIWQVQTPKILSLHGKWKGSLALPDTTVQTELVTCLRDRNPLPKDLRPTWALSLPSQHPHGRPINSGDNFWVWTYLSLLMLPLLFCCFDPNPKHVD